MRRLISWKNFVPFATALFLSLPVNSFFAPEKSAHKNPQPVKSFYVINHSNKFQGSGISGGCFGDLFEKKNCFACKDGKEIVQTAKGKSIRNSRSSTKPFQIISKPKVDYTDEARQNRISGIVRLRVDFWASGQIGNVAIITGLPNGLSEQAITAAKQIKFKPAVRDGKSTSTTKIVEYNFTLD